MRLRQVFVNLLSNAVKFTARGGRVRVEVRGAADGALVEVTDTGKGMDAAFLPKAFDVFVQADQSSTRETGGLGLGLAIVRQLVQHHGGAVFARSDGIGKGSSFVVKLPLADAAA
jgi:signal transduction histidine kinase